MNAAIQRLVVLTGSGMSAESGIPTFQGAGGIWEGHDVTQVASPEAWRRDPAMVLRFYNMRREVASQADPNPGHVVLHELEQHFDVRIVTQNVDNLHERAGSTEVLHLHGELFKSRSTKDPSRIYDIDGTELNLGDRCELGSQLRPHIVWFGEPVPLIETAALVCAKADLFIVVGTSLAVYPAAGLIDFVRAEVPKFVIDPVIPDVSRYENVTTIEAPATSGLAELQPELARRFAV